MMNSRQTMVMWIGIGLIALSCLFPPWLHTFTNKNFGSQVKPAGYGLIFDPPQPQKGNFLAECYGVRLDIARLLLQILGTVVITAGLVISLKDKRAQ